MAVRGTPTKGYFSISSAQHQQAINAGARAVLPAGHYKNLSNGRVVDTVTGETFSRRAKLNTTKGYIHGSVHREKDWHGWKRVGISDNRKTLENYLNSLAYNDSVMITVCGIVLEGFSDLEAGEYGCRTMVSNSRKSRLKLERLYDKISANFDEVDSIHIASKPGKYK